MRYGPKCTEFDMLSTSFPKGKMTLQKYFQSNYEMEKQQHNATKWSVPQDELQKPSSFT